VSDQHLRIGDAEREDAARELGEHYAQGRLTTEEHAERFERIWAARTRGELGPVFADLPGRYGPHPPSSPSAARRATSWSGGMAPLRRGLPTPIAAVLVVVLAVFLVLTIVTHLPLILVGVLVVLLVRGRHRRALAQTRWSR
jgi:Flp pilus assembly protein TadB